MLTIIASKRKSRHEMRLPAFLSVVGWSEWTGDTGTVSSQLEECGSPRRELSPGASLQKEGPVPEK